MTYSAQSKFPSKFAFQFGGMVINPKGIWPKETPVNPKTDLSECL